MAKSRYWNEIKDDYINEEGFVYSKIHHSVPNAGVAKVWILETTTPVKTDVYIVMQTKFGGKSYDGKGI